MKTINLRGVSEILNEREMKSTIGGSQGVGSRMAQILLDDDRFDEVDSGTGNCYTIRPCDNDSDWAACNGRLCNDPCYNSNLGRWGKCILLPAGPWLSMCKTCATGGFGL